VPVEKDIPKGILSSLIDPNWPQDSQHDEHLENTMDEKVFNGPHTVVSLTESHHIPTPVNSNEGV